MLFTQCKEHKKAPKENKADQTDMKEKPELVKDTKEKGILPIAVDREYAWPGTTDHFEIISKSIVGDSLILEVEYGGGCETHDFHMHTNQIWKKSNPIQLNIWLEHNSHEDRCRAMLRETLVFDLKNCRYKMGGTTVLILNGENDSKLNYNY